MEKRRSVYAYLIASSAKKEYWESYMNKVTGNRLEWIENPQDKYCVIAIKAYIKKREETFGEIRDDYYYQINRAEKVFVFHVRTGTSYANIMFKERENLYYGVIDLNPKTGDPVKSNHNKLILQDFNHKLFNEIDSTDEKVTNESTEKNPLCTKTGRVGKIKSCVKKKHRTLASELTNFLKLECSQVGFKHQCSPEDGRRRRYMLIGLFAIIAVILIVILVPVIITTT